MLVVTSEFPHVCASCSALLERSSQGGHAATGAVVEHVPSSHDIQLTHAKPSFAKRLFACSDTHRPACRYAWKVPCRCRRYIPSLSHRCRTSTTTSIERTRCRSDAGGHAMARLAIVPALRSCSASEPGGGGGGQMSAAAALPPSGITGLGVAARSQADPRRSVACRTSIGAAWLAVCSHVERCIRSVMSGGAARVSRGRCCGGRGHLFCMPPAPPPAPPCSVLSVACCGQRLRRGAGLV